MKMSTRERLPGKQTFWIRAREMCNGAADSSRNLPARTTQCLQLVEATSKPEIGESRFNPSGGMGSRCPCKSEPPQPCWDVIVGLNGSWRRIIAVVALAACPLARGLRHGMRRMGVLMTVDDPEAQSLRRGVRRDCSNSEWSKAAVPMVR